MTDEVPVFVRFNVSHYLQLLRLGSLTERERKTVADLLAECEVQSAATVAQSELVPPNAA